MGLALSGEALALEKCVGADGKITYSDKACPAGAKRAAMAGAPAGSTVPIEMEYYDVSGPGGHRGTAWWKVGYKYTPKPQRDGSCAADTVTTELSLKIRMPRWTPQSGASAAVVTKWQVYLSALEVHEQGHLQQGRDLESSFLGAVRGMRAADCGTLQSAVRARYDALFEQAKQRDLEYDKQTKHGATQGASF
ncbi:MAG: hypothetical protein QOD26_3337 [Betaproteobacteria bacterium]|jgi:predicted secreted Zn-dependent protease|nr:hypothetical protein [Betaproteobacteria bacterium]